MTLVPRCWTRTCHPPQHRWIVRRGDNCERDKIAALCTEAAAEGVGRFNGLCGTEFRKALQGLVVEVCPRKP